MRHHVSAEIPAHYRRSAFVLRFIASVATRLAINVVVMNRSWRKLSATRVAIWSVLRYAKPCGIMTVSCLADLVGDVKRAPCQPMCTTPSQWTSAVRVGRYTARTQLFLAMQMIA
jgi:hypothetical protein